MITIENNAGVVTAQNRDRGLRAEFPVPLARELVDLIEYAAKHYASARTTVTWLPAPETGSWSTVPEAPAPAPAAAAAAAPEKPKKNAEKPKRNNRNREPAFTIVGKDGKPTTPTELIRAAVAKAKGSLPYDQAVTLLAHYAKASTHDQKVRSAQRAVAVVVRKASDMTVTDAGNITVSAAKGAK